MEFSVGFKFGSHSCCASILKYSPNQGDNSFEVKRVETSKYMGKDVFIEEEETDKQIECFQDEGNESNHSFGLISKRNAFQQMKGFREIIEKLINRIKETDQCGVCEAFFVTISEGLFEEQRQFIKRVFKERLSNKDLMIMYISEPFAASYYYTYNDSHEQNVIVYNLGYRSFDASLVHIKNGVYEVKRTLSDSRISGEVFDLIIKRIIWDKLEIMVGHELSPINDPDSNTAYDQRIDGLMKMGEDVKEQLNEKDEVVVDTTVFKDEKWYPSGHLLSVTITKEEVKKKMVVVLERTKNLVLKCIQEYNPKGEIDQILLVGGSCCHRLVKDYLKQVFGDIVKDDTDSALKCISHGAALMGKRRDIKEIGNDKESLYNICYCHVKNDKRKWKVISKGQSLPTLKSCLLNHSDYREGYLDFYYYKQKDDDSPCEPIGEVTLENEQLKKEAQVKTTFILQKNHVLTIEHTLVYTRELLKRITIQL